MTGWMNLKDIMLMKDKKVRRAVKFMETRKYKVVVRAGENVV